MRLPALVLALALATAPLVAPSFADDRVWHHATSLIGEPKYPEGFKHFDYVNPEAPKGGTVRLSDMGSFDTFNPILPQGEPASGLGLVFERLNTASDDEISTSSGALAEASTFPDDYSSVTFRMNPRAKWQDGTPVTAEDVVWSFNKQKELSPRQANYYANVTKAEVTAPGEVTFSFDQTGNRELPNIMGQLLVLPQHWWEGTDANGNKRDIGKSTLEPPMGSGPYRIKSFEAGRSITYERVPDYWAKDEGFAVGQNNFDTIRYELFADTTAEFEAFKSDTFDWWDENLALRWQQGYDFPAVNDGRVIKETFENPYRRSGIMVGFVPNLRLPLFQDPALREAMNAAFDFEELDKLRFFGQYERINSYFYGTPLASSGLPEGKELEILNSVKDLVPASVFTTPYANPVSGDPQKLRANLKASVDLLSSAGYKLSGNQLLDPKGQPVKFELLLNGPTLEPIATNFVNNLKKIGIAATIRTVDSAQYIERVQKRQFDMIYTGWPQTLSPGNEQRDFWGSASATQDDSSNYAGISDKGVDALIDKIIYAPDRDTLIATTHALDRVLLAHRYVVPTYTLRKSRIARWDRFSHPDKLPEYAIGFPDTWWFDPAKAAKTGAPSN
jgi:microcin C transport system substrate-binding protein